jgi:DNA adenine methylase
MTYDDAPELHDLARRHGLQTALVPMKNTHHAEMTELLIGRDLAWARTHQDVLY